MHSLTKIMQSHDVFSTSILILVDHSVMLPDSQITIWHHKRVFLQFSLLAWKSHEVLWSTESGKPHKALHRGCLRCSGLADT
jgi:hypothetical protein